MLDSRVDYEASTFYFTTASPVSLLFAHIDMILSDILRPVSARIGCLSAIKSDREEVDLACDERGIFLCVPGGVCDCETLKSPAPCVCGEQDGGGVAISKASAVARPSEVGAVDSMFDWGDSLIPSPFSCMDAGAEEDGAEQVLLSLTRGSAA